MPENEVTSEQLDALRDENESLRKEEERILAEIADETRKRELRYEAERLLVENQRIKARIEARKAQADQAARASGSDSNSQANMRDLEAAQLALENPQGVPVDTNSGVTEEPVVIEPPASGEEPKLQEQTSDSANDPALAPGFVTEPPTPAEEQVNDQDEESVRPPSLGDIFKDASDAQSSDGVSESTDNAEDGEQ